MALRWDYQTGKNYYRPYSIESDERPRCLPGCGAFISTEPDYVKRVSVNEGEANRAVGIWYCTKCGMDHEYPL